MDATKIIIRPIMTEKSFIDAAKGEYTFEVEKNASKKEIAQAIHELYKVDVRGVKTRITKGKSRRMLSRRERTKVSPVKKATVRTGKEQKIDLFEVKQ